MVIYIDVCMYACATLVRMHVVISCEGARQETGMTPLPRILKLMTPNCTKGPASFLGPTEQGHDPVIITCHPSRP